MDSKKTTTFVLGQEEKKRICLIEAEMITGFDEVDIASSATAGKDVKASWDRMLHSEHSPIRTVIYRIKMMNLPSFVSVHYVRHKIGVEHFVKSLRVDRCGTGVEDRWSSVDHVMVLNVQTLF